MKKILLAVLLAGSVKCTYAQYTLPNKTTFGFKGGVNFANMALTQTGTSGSYTFKTLTAFSAGVFADLVVTENFSIQPGVYYSVKGLKFDELSLNFEFEPGFTGSLQTKIDNKITYVELPLHFLYNSSVSTGKFFLGAGPFAAAAVKAKNKGQAYSTITIGNQTTNKTEDINDEVEIGKEGGIKRLDYGATALLGFRFNNGLLLSTSYDYGMANINFDNDGSVTKTRTLTLSLGFSF